MPASLQGTKCRRASGADCEGLLNARVEEVPTTFCHWLCYTMEMPYSLFLMFLQIQKGGTVKVKQDPP